MDKNPYQPIPVVPANSDPATLARPRFQFVWILAAGLLGLLATYALWATMYWHWESIRAEPVETVDEASYQAHVWCFYCVVMAVGSFLCLAAFAWGKLLRAVARRS